ncbi:hypothetical protein Tco_0606684 [Tanacetum coccineum]
MYMNSWDKLSLESYKAKCEKLEKENEKYIITFSSLYDNDRQYTKNIKEQEDLIETMSDQLVELKNTVMIQQTTISNLEECLHKKDFENEHLKSKVIDFTTVQNLRAQVKELQSENELLKSKVIDCTMYQNLQVQVEELKSVNESLNLTIEELSKARALAEAILRERDEMINAQWESDLLEKIDQMKSQVSNLSEKLWILDQETSLILKRMKKDIALCGEFFLTCAKVMVENQSA